MNKTIEIPVAWLERLIEIKDILGSVPTNVSQDYHEAEWKPYLIGYIESAKYLLDNQNNPEEKKICKHPNCKSECDFPEPESWSGEEFEREKFDFVIFSPSIDENVLNENKIKSNPSSPK